jgi:hypothetical protein
MRYLPLIDYSKPAPRRSKLVAVYRWFVVIACVCGVIAIKDGYFKLIEAGLL